jgi:hypothetical protein
MNILIYGEEILVLRHSDILSKTKGTFNLISVYEEEDIPSLEDINQVLLCSRKRNNLYEEHILLNKKEISIFKVNDEYISAFAYYYLTLLDKDLEDINLINFMELLNTNIKSICLSLLNKKLNIESFSYDLTYDLTTGYSSTILPLLESKRNKNTISLFQNLEVLTDKYFKDLDMKKIVIDEKLNFNNRALEIVETSKLYVSPEYSKVSENMKNISFPHTILHKPINIKTHLKLLKYSDYIFIPTRTELKKIEYILTNNKDSLYKKICLIPGGYPKLDILRRDLKQQNIEVDSICYAPTILEHNAEFKDSLTLYNGKDIVEFLLENYPSYNIIFRPSPTTRRFAHTGLDIVNDIVNTFKDNPRFIYDTSIYYIKTFARSCVLISDHSSTMITFSFSTYRPFISFNKLDIKQEYEKVFGSTNLDVREKIGLVINDFSKIKFSIDDCLGNGLFYKQKIEEYMQDEVFNLDNSVEYFFNNLANIKDDITHKDWIYV